MRGIDPAVASMVPRRFLSKSVRRVSRQYTLFRAFLYCYSGPPLSECPHLGDAGTGSDTVNVKDLERGCSGHHHCCQVPRRRRRYDVPRGNAGQRECRSYFHYPSKLRPTTTNDTRDHSLSKASREAQQTADVLKLRRFESPHSAYALT